MSKNKHANQERLEKGFRNANFKKFVMALTVMIFVFGLGLLIHDKFTNKTNKQSQNENITSELPGWWYQKYFGKSVCENDNCQPEADPDHDKLTNAQEFFYNSDPTKSHTVGDELDDGDLVAMGVDPSRSGRITFEEAMSHENIVGESLVFNSDIKGMLNEAVDPNKISLPQVSDLELKITNDNSEKNIRKYFADLKSVVNGNFSSNPESYVQSSVDSGNKEAVEQLKRDFSTVSSKLKTITVPTAVLQLHKYYIALYQLLPDVIQIPSSDILADNNNTEGNAWYDKTKAAFVLYQKISLETERLNKQ